MPEDAATYLDLVSECDNYSYEGSADVFHLYLPHDDRPHGIMRPDIVKRMPWTDEFHVDKANRKVRLLEAPAGVSYGKHVTDAFSKVVTKAIEDKENGEFEMTAGRHSEPYLIPGANEFCHLERFSHALFGIVARGAHLTAYTRTKSGELKIWVPRRALNMFTYPGKLDSTVAGGVKASDTPLACILAESREEASWEAEDVKKNIRSVGTLTYVTLYDSPGKKEQNLISPEILYVYDLELEATVEPPKPDDGEVEKFYLMSIDEVKAAMFNREFKTNSAVVVIDFFVRHGIITQENERDYVGIISRMHRRLPIAFAPSIR